MNVVVIQGVLSRAPELRALPSGSSVAVLELTADHPTGRVTVPVAWFDPPAKANFEAGAEVVVTGYVRRRFFRSGGATQSRTEVVADTVVPANARVRARKAVEQAINVVAEGLGG